MANQIYVFPQNVYILWKCSKMCLARAKQFVEPGFSGTSRQQLHSPRQHSWLKFLLPPRRSNELNLTKFSAQNLDASKSRPKWWNISLSIAITCNLVSCCRDHIENSSDTTHTFVLIRIMPVAHLKPHPRRDDTLLFFATFRRLSLKANFRDHS